MIPKPALALWNTKLRDACSRVVYLAGRVSVVLLCYVVSVAMRLP